MREPNLSWGTLGRAGWRITALVGREVKRTFSEFRRFSTGLPGGKTREAGGQHFGNFRQVIEGLFGHVGDQTRQETADVQKDQRFMD